MRKSDIEKKLDYIEERITDIDNRVRIAQSNSEFVVRVITRIGYWPDIKKESVSNLIRIILNHLGLEIDYVEQKPYEITLKKKEKLSGQKK